MSDGLSNGSGGATVRQSVGWLTLSFVTAGAVNFLYALVLTWVLPPKDYSVFASGQALLLVCGTASSASATWVLARLISRSRTTAGRQAAISFAVTMSLIQGLAAACVVGLVASGFSRGLIPAVVGLSSLVIFEAATAVGFLQGSERFTRIATLRVGEVLVKVGSGMVLIWLGAGVAGAIGGFAIGALLVFLLGMGPAIVKLRFRLGWLADREMWAQMVGLATIQASVAVVASLDLILGSLIVHDGAALSGYQVSVMLSRIPIFLASAVAMPVFTRLVAQQDLGVPVVKGSLNLLIQLSVPVAIAAATLPLALTGLFLPIHYPAKVVAFLPFTATTGILAAGTSLLSTYFQAQSRFVSCFRLLAVGLVLDAAAIIAGIAWGGTTGLAVGSLLGQVATIGLLMAGALHIWGRKILPVRQTLMSGLVASPLLVLRPAPFIWLSYGALLAVFTGWSTFLRGRMAKVGKQPNFSDPGRRVFPHALASRTVQTPDPGLMRVYLLTSHPVAPPWNGSEKNMARSLLEAEMDNVEYTFVGQESDMSAWPAKHARRALRFRTGVPTSREMLYLYRHLLFDSYQGDLIHTIVTFGPSTGSQSALLALPLVKRHRMIITCLSGYHMPLRLLRQAAAVVSISHQTEQRLRAAGLGNVFHIPPGIDVDRFRPRSAVEAQCALDVRQGPAVLYAGHYDGRGGLENALEVLKRLKASVPSAYLLLAMRGRAGQDLSRADAEMRALASSLGLLDSVVELGPKADMQLAIQASTAVLFQPRQLGPKMDLPMTLLEALAGGRPVVTSTVPTLCELADGSPAVLTAERPDQTVAEHCSRLMNDEAYRRFCSDAARRLAIARYSAAAMTASYEDLYRQVLADRDSSGAASWNDSRTA